MSASPPDLVGVVADLARLYPAAPPLTDPLALIVWENVGYLVDDARRAALYSAFVARVGLDPAAIAAASPAVLLELAEGGGMRPEVRVERLRSIGALACAEAGGDLGSALRSLPSAKARRLLGLFPGIGEPGADKVLLFSGVEARPALDSNGLRVLARLGHFDEQPSYPLNYRAGVEALRSRGRPEREWLMTAWSVLRAHGQALCRRGAAQCLACPLDAACDHRPVSL